MKVLIYDATEKSFVGWTWKVGAILLRPFFKAVIPAKSWEHALSKVEEIYRKHGKIDEIQLWSHGASGAPLIDRYGPVRQDKRLGYTKRWWFRCCYTLAGDEGYSLARSFQKKGCEVVGHTGIIGHWAMHSYLYAVRPGEEPWWPKERQSKSTPRSPRTVPAVALNVPSWAYGPRLLTHSKDE